MLGAGQGSDTVPPVAAAQSTSSYVRLRGLPFVATEQEVAHWFAAAPSGPIQVIRVVLTFNTTGRKSGEAVRRCLQPASRLQRAHCRASHPHASELLLLLLL